MLEKIKRIGIISIIALLYALFAFSIVDVIEERPDYMDFCPNPEVPKILGSNKDCNPIQVSTEEERSCGERRGYIQYTYDSNGCATSYECNTCSSLYEQAGKQHRLIGFIITSIFGIIGILVGIYVKGKGKEEVTDWIFSGILIGGILSILFGTISYFSDMGRYIKPVVLLIELGLIIFIAMKTVGKK